MTRTSRPLDPLFHRRLSILLQTLDGVNIEALGTWIVAGVPLFSEGDLPSLQAVTKTARKVVLALAMQRYDKNITHVAGALGASRRAVREQLKAAGLYDMRDGELAEGVPNGGVFKIDLGDPTDIAFDEDADTHPIRLSDGERRESITREMISETARRLHPAAFVYMQPGQPVLVDDGLSWLLFFDDWWNGCQYTCRYTYDGKDIGPIRSRGHLETVLATMAGVHGEADEHALEGAARHITDLTQLSGTEVYRRARAHAEKRFDS